MIKRRSYLLLLLLAGFCVAQETKKIGPLTVTMTQLSGINPGSMGYQTIQFKVVNGDQKPHELSIVLGHLFRMENQIERVVKSLNIEAGNEAVVKLRTWRQVTSPTQVTFSLDGRRIDETFEIPFGPRNARPYMLVFHFNILTDKQAPTINPALIRFLDSTAADVLSGTINPSDLKQLLWEEAKPVALWGDHWLDYSPYDLVQLTGEQWRKLSALQKKALTTWLQCGGTLFIHESDRASLPMEWQLPPGQMVNPHLGLGHLLIRPENEPFSQAEVAELMTRLIETKSGRWNFLHMPDLNIDFQVAEDLALPLKSLFLLLMVFSLIIGPANYLYLARKNRRVWMMVTIPAIAISATLAVASYAMIKEMGTSCVRRESFVFLNELEHRAVIKEKVGIYSPTSLKPPQFNADTLVGSTVNLRNRLTLDWTNGQTLKGGWISAREPFFYQTTRNEIRRERLAIEKKGSDFMVANHLGAPVEILHFTDENGHIYKAENVAVGQTVKAVDMDRVAKPESMDLYKFLELDWRVEHKADNYFCREEPNLCLEANRYLAILSGSPFEAITHEARTEHHKTLVYGVWEVQQ